MADTFKKLPPPPAPTNPFFILFVLIVLAGAYFFLFGPGSTGERMQGVGNYLRIVGNTFRATSTVLVSNSTTTSSSSSSGTVVVAGQPAAPGRPTIVSVIARSVDGMGHVRIRTVGGSFPEDLSSWRLTGTRLDIALLPALPGITEIDVAVPSDSLRGESVLELRDGGGRVVDTYRP